MINKKINLLDCTLRDGGYYNNWFFEKELINEYLRVMSFDKDDYVEIGFRFLDKIKAKDLARTLRKLFEKFKDTKKS